jgi:hypothetical protein
MYGSLPLGAVLDEVSINTEFEIPSKMREQEEKERRGGGGRVQMKREIPHGPSSSLIL